MQSTSSEPLDFEPLSDLSQPLLRIIDRPILQPHESFVVRFSDRIEYRTIVEFANRQFVSDFDHGQADGRRNSVATWEALGVRPIGGQSWSDAARMMDAKLLLPAGHRGPKLLTFKNFDVIKRYNNSTSYALGIHNLAESLKGRRAITTSWPKSDKPLSRTDKEEMQKRLTALGFDTKGVDGQIGPNTRRAIRGWQRANGVPADGYVEQTLFARIMGR